VLRGTEAVQQIKFEHEVKYLHHFSEQMLSEM